MKDLISSAAPLVETFNGMSPDAAKYVLGAISVYALYKIIDKAMDKDYEIEFSADAERNNYNFSFTRGKVTTA